MKKENTTALITIFWREKVYLFGLLVICAIAAWIRWLYLSQPMRYDEAYTFLAFARYPLSYITSNYHVPNNHVLHTLLVHASYLLFGNHPWSIRLPAYLAGLLIVPATFLVCRLLYNSWAALLCAALTAAASPLIEFSTNARGYTLLCLIWLFTLSLSAYLLTKRDWRAWLLFVVLSVLGFYTVPVMVYPFGIVIIWLLLSFFAKDIDSAYGKTFLLHLGIVTGAIVALTILAYQPIVAESGLDKLFGNRFVRSLDWSHFFRGLPGEFYNSFKFWIRDYPLVVVALLVAGVVLSLILHRQISQRRVHLLVPTLLALVIILPLQRVLPGARVWLFLLPAFLIWASAGLVGALKKIPLPHTGIPSKYGQWLLAGTIIAITLALSLVVFQRQSVILSDETGRFAEAESTALYLKHNLRSGDVVLSTLPANYPLRYYFIMHDIPLEYLYRKKYGANFDRALVLVDQNHGHELEEMLIDLGLDGVLDPASAILLYRNGAATLYEFER